MHLKLTNIEMDNAAFTDSPKDELGAILCQTANEIIDGKTSGKFKDINGHSVGEWEIVTED